MNWIKKHKVLSVVIGLLLLIVIGNMGSNDKKEVKKDTVSISTAAADNKAVKTEAPKPQVIEISAQDLANAYESNEVKADQDYKNKQLKITGIVKDIGKDILNDMYVSLEDGKEYSILSVQCFFEKSSSDKLASLKKGDSITIVGKCTGKLMNVLVKNCKFE